MNESVSVNRLAYNYVEIDLETGECISVFTSSRERTGEEYIRIERYNEEYFGKFYRDGAWYEDAEFTIPWSPTV